MIFKTPEQLVEFFNRLDLDKSTLIFKDSDRTTIHEGVGDCGCGTQCAPKVKDCACGGNGPCQCATKKPIPDNAAVKVVISSASSVMVESFSDNPVFSVDICEGASNIFYVKEYESVPNFCGTGQIVLENRTTYMNMCEIDGSATVLLNLNIGGQKFRDVPFTLERTTDTPRIVLSKSYIDQL